jgi:endonuclease YncB( thermonuclease family)
MPASLIPQKINVRTYSALFRRVKETLLEGQRSIEAQKVRTYWDTGRLIQTHILQNNGRADYGANVMVRLSDDLDVSKDVLHRCVKFYGLYPDLRKVATSPQLRWSHYQELISIPDDKARSRLESAIGKSGLSISEVRSRKMAGRAAEDAEVSETTHYPLSTIPSATLLTPLQGTLYTYQVFKRKVLSAGTSELVLDLGFSNYRDVEALTGFSTGDIVESRPKADRDVLRQQNGGYRLVKGVRTSKDLYTYQAYVEKVVDGDTLKVHIDLGFATWTRQTLRLHGIDCPEMKTKDGDAAKAFVQSYLKEASQIILRSSRSDKYDRYLADIFIPHGDGTEDIYLNNLLLEQGHAEQWEP